MLQSAFPLGKGGSWGGKPITETKKGGGQAGDHLLNNKLTRPSANSSPNQNRFLQNGTPQQRGSTGGAGIDTDKMAGILSIFFKRWMPDIVVSISPPVLE